MTPNGEVFELGAGRLHTVCTMWLSNILQGLEDIEDLGDVETAVTALRGAIERRKQLLLTLETDSKTLSKDRIKKIAGVAAMRAEAETVSRLSKRYRAIFRLKSRRATTRGRLSTGSSGGSRPCRPGRTPW